MIEPQVVILSSHAIERFRERARPALDLADAEEELARLATVAELSADPPSWHAARTAHDSDAYLVIADVVLPLVQRSDGEYVATTCLVRGSLSEASRVRRNRHRASRRTCVGRVPAPRG